MQPRWKSLSADRGLQGSYFTDPHGEGFLTNLGGSPKKPRESQSWCRLGTQSSVYMECCFRSSDLTADTDSRTQFTDLATDPGRNTLCPQQYCLKRKKYFVFFCCLFVLEKHKSPSTVLTNKNLNSLIKFQIQNKRISGKSFSSKLVTNHL